MGEYQIQIYEEYSGTLVQSLECTGETVIIPNFTAEELCCPLTYKASFRAGFLNKLKMFRKELGMPMEVNSCARSEKHNAIVGGHNNSLHLIENPKWQTLGCEAIDIDMNGKSVHYINECMKLATKFNLSVGVGWKVKNNRGVGFMHLDDRTQAIGLPRTIFYYK